MDLPRRRRRLGAGLIACIVLAACAKLPPPAPSAVPSPPPDPHATGGTLTAGIWQEPGTLLAAGIVDRNTFAGVLDAPVAEGLLWYRPAEETARARGTADHWRPLLATEVPTLENGGVRTRGCPTPGARMCVTWRLRRGVRWHDGSAFGAHDVCDTHRLFHLRYHDSNPTALLSTAGWDQVLACTEVDQATALVEYRSLYGPYLSLGSGVYGILPAAILDRAFAANADLQALTVDLDLRRGSGNPAAFAGRGTLDRVVDGTGPFVLSAYEPGRRMTLVANHDYWDLDHRPRLDRIVFVFEPDLSTTVNDVKAGALDMAFDLRLSHLADLTATAAPTGLVLRTVPAPGAERLDLNLCAAAGALCDPDARRAPYPADPAVRRALLAGINRQAIVDRVAPGRTAVPPDSWISLGMPELADPGVTATAYDPAAAARILDAAGYPLHPYCENGRYRAYRDGTCISVALGTTAEDPVRATIEGMVAADLTALGIRVIQPYTPQVPSADFFGSFADGGPLYRHGFDLALHTSTAISPGEPDRYYALYHADCRGSCPDRNQIPAAADQGRGENATAEDDPDLDRALDAGRGTVDLAARTRAYREAARLLARDLPQIPLFQQLTVNVHATTVQGVHDNELVWDFDAADWYCTAGRCAR